MKEFLNGTGICSTFIPSIFLSAFPPAPGGRGKISGSVTLTGEVTGSGKGPLDHSSNYSGKYSISVKYSIETKKDSKGKVVFDLATSTANFTDSKWKWTTLEIPIREIKGDPGTGKIESFKFKGVKWYTKAATDGVVDNGIEGSVKIDPKDPKKGTGSIKASYKDKTGTNESTYSFVSEKPKPKSKTTKKK
ncbi:MAG: hypothetical protein GY859_04500 [Desulfobacterales bacterium]|nr:hypothetical protein [Desulfobacterales bacterium]